MIPFMSNFTSAITWVLSSNEPLLMMDGFILESRPDKSFETLNKMRVVGPDANGANRAIALVDFLVPPDFSPSQEGACLSFMISNPIFEESTLKLVQLEQPLSQDGVTWRNTFPLVEGATLLSTAMVGPSFDIFESVYFDVAQAVVSSENYLTFAITTSNIDAFVKFFATEGASNRRKRRPAALTDGAWPH